MILLIILRYIDPLKTNWHFQEISLFSQLYKITFFALLSELIASVKLC